MKSANQRYSAELFQAIKKDGDFPRFFVAFFLAEMQKTKNATKDFFFSSPKSIQSQKISFFFGYIQDIKNIFLFCMAQY